MPERGHKLGARGSRRSAVTEMFTDSGASISDVRRLVLEQTIANAKEGGLARLVLPGSRPTPHVFKGAATVSERADALLAALETGAVTAQEAALIAKGSLEYIAQSQECREVQERLDKLAASAPVTAPLRVIHTHGVVRLPAPAAAVDAEVEPVALNAQRSHNDSP